MTWSRSAKLYQWRGRDYTLTQLSRLVGIPNYVLRSRLARGWTLEEALSEPKGAFNGRIVEHDGRALTIAEWASEVGMSEETLRSRLKLGWTFERAVRQDVRGSK